MSNGAVWTCLPFVQLQGQAIWVRKEGEPPARVLIDPNLLHGDPLLSRVRNGLFDVGHLERQVSQAARFWIAQPPGRIREGKQFDLGVVRQTQIELIRVAFLAVYF